MLTKVDGNNVKSGLEETERVFLNWNDLARREDCDLLLHEKCVQEAELLQYLNDSVWSVDLFGYNPERTPILTLSTLKTL
jgi:hypothetical protein